MAIEKERPGLKEGPFLSGSRYWEWVQRETPPNEEARIAQATAKRTQRKTLPKMEEGQGLPFNDWWISPPEHPEIANATVKRFHELVRQIYGTKYSHYQGIKSRSDHADPILQSQLKHLLGEFPTELKVISYSLSELRVRDKSGTKIATIAVAGTPDSTLGFVVTLRRITKSISLFQANKTLINFISPLNNFLESQIPQNLS